jgi:choline dehydrogenase-like flavoprotein
VDFDVVIAGGGTAGCLLAGRLSEDPGRSVCLVEAGLRRARRADASIMPTIPKANANLTTAAIAEKLAQTI